MSQTSKTHTKTQSRSDTADTAKATAAKAAEAPKAAAQAAERATAQAEATVERAGRAAGENAKAFDTAATAFADGTSQFHAKAIEMAQANMNAGFEFTRKLLSTRDAGEAFALQESFLRERTQTVTRQVQELGTLSIQLAETTVKPVQDGVTKSFDEMRKTFTA